MATDSEESLDIGQIMLLAVEKKLCDVNVSMPASIVSYDATKNIATVKPAFKTKFVDSDSAEDLPNIFNVPVIFPRMGNSHLVLPIKAGNTGMLVFQQRSIDGWISRGGTVDPQDKRKFALSDAVFVVGLHSQSEPLERKGATTSAELANDKGFIEVLPAGKFKISNGSLELFSLLVETLGEMVNEMTEQGEQDFTNTIFGPQQPVNFAKYTELKTKYEAIKEKLEELKG